MGTEMLAIQKFLGIYWGRFDWWTLPPTG